jgi:hypothetical protein
VRGCDRHWPPALCPALVTIRLVVPVVADGLCSGFGRLWGSLAVDGGTVSRTRPCASAYCALGRRLARSGAGLGE